MQAKSRNRPGRLFVDQANLRNQRSPSLGMHNVHSVALSAVCRNNEGIETASTRAGCQSKKMNSREREIFMAGVQTRRADERQGTISLEKAKAAGAESAFSIYLSVRCLASGEVWTRTPS
jgi:hypothetical protein